MNAEHKPRLIVLPEAAIMSLSSNAGKYGAQGIQDGKTPEEIEKAIRVSMTVNGLAVAWCRKDPRKHHRQMQYSAVVPAYVTTQEMMGHMMAAENQNDPT